jgi:hypothetical protein
VSFEVTMSLGPVALAVSETAAINLNSSRERSLERALNTTYCLAATNWSLAYVTSLGGWENT